MNDADRQIVSLDTRLKALEQAVEQLTDNVLKLEDILGTIADTIVPEEEKEK